MTDQATVRGVVRGAWLAVSLSALLAACGTDAPDVASGPAVEPTAPPALDAATLAPVLADSWMRSAVVESDVLAQLLDSPGGDGWLALFHGDLVGASDHFDAAIASGRPEPRLGAARVSLERAATLLQAEALHTRAGADLARYRRDNPDLIRQGRYELPLRALTLLAGGDADEAAAAMAAAREADTPDPTWRLLMALAEARSQDGDPRTFVIEGLPAPLAARAAYGQAITAATAPQAVDLAPGAPDLIDPLGRDAETGLAFDAPWFDPLLLRTLARAELLHARALGSGLGAPGDLIEAAVVAGWGPTPPGHPPADSVPGVSLPAWTALFGSWAIDATDWTARWTVLGGGDASATGLLTRLDAAWPAGDLRSASGAAAVDALLRDQEPLRDAARALLVAGASPDGLSLVVDLGLPERFVDALLRDRMDALVAAGEPAQARRLGERALDPNPGEQGDEAGFTRVSHRNDRPFLLRFATCLHLGGRPGLAREYTFPLAQEQPELSGVTWILGQLDAASGIGVRGKVSQQ